MGFIITASFDGEATRVALHKDGDQAELVRDEVRRVVVTLTSSEPSVPATSAPDEAKSEPLRLVVLPWPENAFAVRVDSVTYRRGPVVLCAESILQLCAPHTWSDPLTFVVTVGDAETNSLTSRATSVSEPPLPTSMNPPAIASPSVPSCCPSMSREDLSRAVEIAKWNNHYHYRYSVCRQESNSANATQRCTSSQEPPPMIIISSLLINDEAHSGPSSHICGPLPVMSSSCCACPLRRPARAAKWHTPSSHSEQVEGLSSRPSTVQEDGPLSAWDAFRRSRERSSDYRRTVIPPLSRCVEDNTSTHAADVGSLLERVVKMESMLAGTIYA